MQEPSVRTCTWAEGLVTSAGALGLAQKIAGLKQGLPDAELAQEESPLISPGNLRWLGERPGKPLATAAILGL